MRLSDNGFTVGQKPVDYLEIVGNFKHHARSGGGDRSCLRILGILDFMEVLGKLGINPGAVKICCALAVVHMLCPASEHRRHCWMTMHSAIWILLGLNNRLPFETAMQTSSSGTRMPL